MQSMLFWELGISPSLPPSLPPPFLKALSVGFLEVIQLVRTNNETKTEVDLSVSYSCVCVCVCVTVNYTAH